MMHPRGWKGIAGVMGALVAGCRSGRASTINDGSVPPPGRGIVAPAAATSMASGPVIVREDEQARSVATPHPVSPASRQRDEQGVVARILRLDEAAASLNDDPHGPHCEFEFAATLEVVLPKEYRGHVLRIHIAGTPRDDSLWRHEGRLVRFRITRADLDRSRSEILSELDVQYLRAAD
jgi:hypothetical protein